MLCLVLSLAGLEISQPVDDLAVVFLLDHSDSMPLEAQAEALTYVRQAMRSMGPDDQSAVIVFGRDALVERAFSSDRTLGPIASVPDSSQTDLAGAIRLGLALYPPHTARRMVILSDGAETSGDAAQAASFAEAMGVELVAVPFEHQPAVEVSLVDVEMPSHLRQGERFELTLDIQASQSTTAEVRVFADEGLAVSGFHQLSRGLQRLRIPLTAGGPGFIRYQVQVAPQADTYYQNNELAAFSRVLGPPRLLLVAPAEGEPIGLSGQPRPDEASQLARALVASGFILEQVLPTSVPSGDLTGMAPYSGIILVDVPARQLSRRQMRNLQAYVRDLGGGLLAVGGPTSFGVGGYFRTPLEEALPVEMQIKDQMRRPGLALVFVIDRSGSMSSTSGGAAKIELAKEAAARSVELLFPGDRVGVIAFDDSASWVVDMTEVDDPADVTDAIGSLGSGGGTDILAGLQAMARILPEDPASVKHVILLTDGGANPAGIPELVSQLWTEHNITLTTVGIGSDAAPFLAELAEIGHGRYHFAPDPESIPWIFTEETAMVSRSYIVEETFYPQQVAPSPILTGITETPPLHGYVAATGKDLARVVLVSPAEDPILAIWQYGLGRSEAFTSDATGRWAKDWVTWPGYVDFWSQAVRAVTARLEASPLHVEVDMEGGEAILRVDARSEGGDYRNGLRLEANVISPDGSSQSYALRQVAPGSYRAAISPSGQGAYLIRVSDLTDAEVGSSLPATVAGWVLPYSPEYGYQTSDRAGFVQLVQANGGRLADDDPGSTFAHTLTAQAAARPIRPWAVALAAFLLVLDVAVRRLAVGISDLRRGWATISERLRRHRAALEPEPGRQERLQALFEAKERAARTVEEPPAKPLKPEVEPMAIELLIGADEPVASESNQPEPPPSQAEERLEPGTTAARLLALKQRKRKGEDKA